MLLRWEELAEAGEIVSAEKLCRDCPHLSGELQRRIEALSRVAWVCQVNEQPAAAAFPILAPGGEPVLGYRLVQRLGKGGFAEVWMAEGPNGPVALKFIAQTENAAHVEQRSLAVIKHLEHPNLLRTYETWQVDGFFVVAMELADGTLMDRFRQAQAQGMPGIARDELLRYLRDAAEGIDFLQKRYIQHRDIKPQNLFLMGDTLKVGDFGLTRLLAHSITGHSGSLTLSYAPPEFFEGKTTRQSDVYSLAVAYCQMRGGRLPFEGSPAALVAAHLRRVPDLSMLPPQERPAVEKALAKRPDQRWPTCQAFVEALADPSPAVRKQRVLHPGCSFPCWRLPLSRPSFCSPAHGRLPLHHRLPTAPSTYPVFHRASTLILSAMWRWRIWMNRSTVSSPSPMARAVQHCGTWQRARSFAICPTGAGQGLRWLLSSCRWA